MKVRIFKVVSDSLEDEKLTIEVMEDCNMNQFLVFDTTYDDEGCVSNLERHVYLFKSLPVNKGDFVRLFTRSQNDNDKLSFENKRETTTYQLFWGLDHQIWNKNTDVAYLLHYDDWEKYIVNTIEE